MPALAAQRARPANRALAGTGLFLVVAFSGLAIAAFFYWSSGAPDSLPAQPGRRPEPVQQIVQAPPKPTPPNKPVSPADPGKSRPQPPPAPPLPPPPLPPAPGE
jgi:hypothetical protein